MKIQRTRALLLHGAAALLVAALLIPEPALAQANECNGRPCVRIGTFNLDSLGVRGRTGGPELRDQAGVERLVQLAVDVLGIDVLVLQEINTSINEEENGVQLKSTQQYEWLRSALRQRGYELYGSGFGASRSTLMAWNKETVTKRTEQTLLVRTSFDLGGGCAATELPPSRALGLRAGELDFIVVGVQLIAPDETAGSTRSARGACEDRIRAEQVDDLLVQVDSLDRTYGDPVFLAGDFGAKAGRGSLKELKKAGKFIQLTRKGQRQKGSGRVSSLQPRLLGDHVMYRKRESRRTWVPKSTLIFNPDGAGADYADFIARYADHVPVFTELYTDGS